jgi:site-specific recombinase XerD
MLHRDQTVARSTPQHRGYRREHSFASDALGGGVPLAIVGEMLGHRQPSTTKRYAHLANRGGPRQVVDGIRGP